MWSSENNEYLGVCFFWLGVSRSLSNFHTILRPGCTCDHGHCIYLSSPHTSSFPCQRPASSKFKVENDCRVKHGHVPVSMPGDRRIFSRGRYRIRLVGDHSFAHLFCCYPFGNDGVGKLCLHRSE